ncbi:MAG: LysR family transcriptional regulator [Pseudomonadota bacterium]
MSEPEAGVAVFELRELRNFVAVAERLNVSKAAEVVHISQSALTRQIQALENKLGIALFERLGKRLILTAEGEDLLGRAALLLDHAQELSNHAFGLEQGHSGVLRVAASPQTNAWLMSPAIAEFRTAYPNVDLNLSEGHNDNLLSFVEHGAAHVSVAHLGVNNLLLGTKLFVAQLFALLPPGHRLAAKRKIRITDIASDDLLVMRRGFLTRHLFDKVCAAHEMRPRLFLESDSTHTLVALARDGHGVAIVSTSARDTRELEHAKPIVSARTETQANVSAIWNPKRYRPAALPAFIETLEKHAREQS